MKRIIYLLIFISIIFTGYLVSYFNQYQIQDDKHSIQSGLKEWYDRGTDVINPKVLKVVQLDDTNSYVVLFQAGSKTLGYAHYIKGWNGRYKITQSGHRTNIVSYQKIKTNKGIYGILIGQNPDLRIDHVLAELYYKDYKFTSDVSNEKKFVKYKKIPSGVKEPFPAELTLYDKNGSVIDMSELLN